MATNPTFVAGCFLAASARPANRPGPEAWRTVKFFIPAAGLLAWQKPAASSWGFQVTLLQCALSVCLAAHACAVHLGLARDRSHCQCRMKTKHTDHPQVSLDLCMLQHSTSHCPSYLNAAAACTFQIASTALALVVTVRGNDCGMCPGFF